MGGYAWVIWKYCVILYEGLEHPWISVCGRVGGRGCPGTNLPWIPKDDYNLKGRKYA